MQENGIYEQLAAIFINRTIKHYTKVIKTKDHQKVLEIMGNQKLVLEIQYIMNQAACKCGYLVHGKLGKLEFKESKP